MVAGCVHFPIGERVFKTFNCSATAAIWHFQSLLSNMLTNRLRIIFLVVFRSAVGLCSLHGRRVRMNACGYYNHPEKNLHLPAGHGAKYPETRSPGPLLDRIDRRVELPQLISA